MILVPMTVVGLVTDRNGNGKRFADISVNYELLQKLSVLGGERIGRSSQNHFPEPLLCRRGFICTLSCRAD